MIENIYMKELNQEGCNEEIDIQKSRDATGQCCAFLTLSPRVRQRHWAALHCIKTTINNLILITITY